MTLQLTGSLRTMRSLPHRVHLQWAQNGRAKMPLITRRERLRRSLELPSEPCVISKKPEAETALPTKESQVVVETMVVHNPEACAEDLTQSGALAETVIDPYGLGLWMLARCAPDDRWQTSIGRLYLDFRAWRHEVGLPVPSLESFMQDVREARFPIEKDCVRGLALREDLEAHERFQS